MADFIPTRDQDFKGFAQGFADELSKSPGAYGISQADADTVVRAFDLFAEADARAMNPSTRTKGTVDAKNEARNALRDLIRTFASQFRANMGISTQALIEVGVQRRPQTLGRRKCPQTSPAINLKARTPGHDELTYSDSLTLASGSGRKPHGAARLELFASYDHDHKGELPPVDAIYLGSYRKSPIEVPHGAHLKDGEPTYWGRWAGHNDDVGPWSLPATFQKDRSKAGSAKQDSAETNPDQSLPALRKAA